MKRTLSIALLALALAACGGDDDDGGGVDGGVDAAPSASAAVEIEPTSTVQTVTGTGTFTQEAGGVAISLSIANATPGDHGVHIHQNGDCGGEGMNAGDHWNPEDADHGMPGADPSHFGDMGNLTVASDGTASLEITKSEWKIGDSSTGDVVGHALIIHEVADDFGQPLGNAGARIGCGVITEQ